MVKTKSYFINELAVAHEKLAGMTEERDHLLKVMRADYRRFLEQVAEKDAEIERLKERYEGIVRKAEAFEMLEAFENFTLETGGTFDHPTFDIAVHATMLGKVYATNKSTLEAAIRAAHAAMTDEPEEDETGTTENCPRCNRKKCSGPVPESVFDSCTGCHGCMDDESEEAGP